MVHVNSKGIHINIIDCTRALQYPCQLLPLFVEASMYTVTFNETERPGRTKLIICSPVCMHVQWLQQPLIHMYPASHVMLAVSCCELESALISLLLLSRDLSVS